MARKPLFGEEMETVGVKLPVSMIHILDLGVAKGVFFSRADGVRRLALIGIESEDFKSLNIENEGVGHLMVLHNLAVWQTMKNRIQEDLAALEEPLNGAVKAGSKQAVQKILETVEFSLSGLEPHYRKIAEDFISGSAVFTLAYERFGLHPEASPTSPSSL